MPFPPIPRRPSITRRRNRPRNKTIMFIIRRAITRLPPSTCCRPTPAMLNLTRLPPLRPGTRSPAVRVRKLHKINLTHSRHQVNPTSNRLRANLTENLRKASLTSNPPRARANLTPRGINRPNNGLPLAAVPGSESRKTSCAIFMRLDKRSVDVGRREMTC